MSLGQRVRAKQPVRFLGACVGYTKSWLLTNALELAIAAALFGLAWWIWS